MNEFLEQFCLESRELVEQATRELLALERSPENRETLDGAFRAFHTLKGCAGIVDFAAMSRSVHVAEESLSAVRQGQASVSSSLIGDCLNVVDQVVQWLDEIEAQGDLPATPDAAADAAVARFQRTQAGEPAPGASRGSVGELREAARLILEEQLLVLAESHAIGRVGRVAAAGRTAANVLRYASRPADAEEIERAVASFLEDEEIGALAGLLKRALNKQRTFSSPPPAAAPRFEPAARTFRVEAERVDALVALTGELIVAKNTIAHLTTLADESHNALAPMLSEARFRLERLVGRLKDTALNLRVIPLRAVFERFQRIVRELGLELGKPAMLVVEGEDTEADKAIVELLFEPLLHIVRNALDHGVEPAGRRAAVGKPPIATLRLSARREGEHVVIEVEDDGAGIDAARVRALAVERNLIDRVALDALAEDEVLELIFLPGFSTKARVSELSGRGVGMDAVRTSVERLGGRVGVASEFGHGTRFRLHLPYSLMVTKVITVEAGGQIFGLPLETVVEIVRVPRDSVQPMGSIEAFVWRDSAMPLVDLAEVLGKPRRRDASLSALAVVISLAGQFAAVGVDRLGQEMEVILKPVEGLLTGMAGIAGATVLGDGQVLLVLDIRDLLA
jgi:two-component system chemotaxis sensor kinase CheA